MGERLVVIGGDAGGMSAASQARRRRGPDDLEILAVERGTYTSYSACGIPYYVGGVVEDLDALITRDPETFRTRYSIEVALATEAVGIDLAARTVRVRRLEDGAERDEPFDHLVVATGAVPKRPRLPGADGARIFGVQTLNDAQALKELIETERPARAVVVGGGYIGLEMAEALVTRGIEVHLVEQAAQPMSSMDPDMGALVADALRATGVQVHCEEAVEGFELDADGAVRAVVTSARTLPAEIVVLGLGVRPNSALAAEAGIPVGDTGGIVTDRKMRTRAEGVWAAGDCVETFHRVSRRPVAIALGTHANKQGRVAGTNIGGGYAAFPGVVGTAVSKICEVEVARTGLKESEAAEAGFETVSVVVESTTRSGYYPGASRMRTKVIADRRSGRVLGAQIVGREGAAKRIDVLATAIWNEMTVEEVQGLDLAYAPPFSPVWDPVLIAARRAWETIEATLGEIR